MVGYPEKELILTSNGSGEDGGADREGLLRQQRNYNSTVTISPSGEILHHYRKSFLYYTDETWASEGAGPHTLPHSPAQACLRLPDLGMVGFGICMDINPHKFTAPLTAYEFANRMLDETATLVVVSMAWLTRLLPEELEEGGAEPDMETVAYWLERFRPLLQREEGEGVTVVFANRCGSEGSTIHGGEVENGNGQAEEVALGVEQGDRVSYAGSSCVMRFQAGSVRMFERSGGGKPGRGGVGILGKGEEGVLVVDTGMPARFVLQQRNG